MRLSSGAETLENDSASAMSDTLERAEVAAAEDGRTPVNRHNERLDSPDDRRSYRLVAERGLKLSHLNVFALDEYVGVPLGEPRTCANLLRRAVAEAWDIPSRQFLTISSLEQEALENVRQHERQIASLGGLDAIVLGLGQNGHLGFNEPGSAEDSLGRLVQLDPVSIEANAKWFSGDYAPSLGVTFGLKTILGARHILIMAYGSRKAAAETFHLDWEEFADRHDLSFPAFDCGQITLEEYLNRGRNQNRRRSGQLPDGKSASPAADSHRARPRRRGRLG